MSQLSSEEQDLLVMFACTALPGVIISLGVLPRPETVAGTAFEIAEAMIAEVKKRTETEENN